MNIELKRVGASANGLATKRRGTKAHSMTKASPPPISTKKNRALRAISAYVTSGKVLRSRLSSPIGNMLPHFSPRLLEQRRGKDGGRRNNALVQRHLVPVTLRQLCLHQQTGQVEGREARKRTQPDPDAPIIRFPDELGTVDALIRPFEIRIVGSAGEGQCRAFERGQPGGIAEQLRVAQPLHDIPALFTPMDPFNERGELNPRYRLEHKRLPVA